MKAGTNYEKFSAEVFHALRTNAQFETVQHDIRLRGADGDRQIDVLLRGRIGPLEVLTIIECKDTATIVSVREVDALHSKMQDVRAQKAVLVTRRGFSKTAKRKAERLGITLCTLQQARHAKWPIIESLPFVFEEIACTRTSVQIEFRATANSLISEKVGLSKFPLARIVAEHWNERDLSFEGSAAVYTFNVRSSDPIWFEIGESHREIVDALAISLHLERAFYFGYLDGLSSTKCLAFVESGKKHVIIDPKELGDYRSRLPRFAARSELPNVEAAVTIKSKLLFNPSATVQGGTLARFEEIE